MAGADSVFIKFKWIKSFMCMLIVLLELHVSLVRVLVFLNYSNDTKQMSFCPTYSCLYDCFAGLYSVKLRLMIGQKLQL